MRLLKRKPAYYKKYMFRYMERFMLKFAPSRQPSFMIIGVQKAATTSLYNLLHRLPNIFKGSLNKETYYFSQEVDYGRSLQWYHSYFKSFALSGSTKFFEASPDYFYFPWVPERLFNYNKALKLIVILREPVARAYSAWKMYARFITHNELYRVSRGLKPNEENYIAKYFFNNRKKFPDFEECVRIELDLMESTSDIWEPSLLRRGLYFDQIQRIHKYFPSEQLLILGFKDLTESPQTELEKILRFLNIPLKENKDVVLYKRNASRDSSTVPPSVVRELAQFYSRPNQQLFDFLGYHPNW